MMIQFLWVNMRRCEDMNLNGDFEHVVKDELNDIDEKHVEIQDE